jgi:hypothetical protein
VARLVGTLAAVAVAVLLASCGGDDQQSVSTVTTTVVSRVTTTVTVPAETTESPEPARSESFQMPSKNIGCLFGFRQLRCDILSGLEPEPNEICDFDWVGVDMGVSGPAAANCGSDTVYDAGAPVLEYGSTWSRGGITCDSEESALTCTNREGHGFSLARGSWSVS